jgi:beta-propeller repeat-containing protein
MNMFTLVIFMAVGLQLTTANSPAQTRNDAGSSNASISTLKSVSATERVVQTFGKFPLTFEGNVGQTDSQVRFLSRGPGYTLLLTSSEAVLVTGKDKGLVARMRLTGTNPTPQVRGLDELASKSYYFIGNDPAKWQSKVPNYARVRYQEVYPGIDLVYYGNQRQLEYDFVVAPGADPKLIKLSFPEARKIRIDRESGDLKLECVGGEVCFHKPVAYQMTGGRSGVEARYVLKQGKQVSIALGSYDVAKPLIVDPVLSYSTYLDDSENLGFAIAVDASGNAYVTGSTTSRDFHLVHPLPPPNNALQGVLNAFVSKLSFDSATSTLSLAYSTYLGGHAVGFGDIGTGISVDTIGNAYVTGWTGSRDFPLARRLVHRLLNNGDVVADGALG